MTCRRYEGGLTICSPNDWVEFSREAVGVKWCFGCRKRLPHDWIVQGESGLTYYEPTGRYDCSGCHRDETLGFGMSREWVS